MGYFNGKYESFKFWIKIMFSDELNFNDGTSLSLS